MADKKTKLELTWIGKENRPRLEPRILLEDSSLSYHAKQRVTDHDLFDNMLIQGDNLLTLKALEQQFAGKIKCVCIDPPYNTGSAFEHYEDGVEHSLWLSLIRDRLEIIKRLLRSDGSIWIIIDDSEAHYLKVMCDEIFGRSNYFGNIVWQHSVQGKNDAKTLSVHHNYVLVYRRSESFARNLLSRQQEHNVNYSNPDGDPRGPWRSGDVRSPHLRENLKYNVTAPSGSIIPPPENGWRWRKEIFLEKVASGEIVFRDGGRRVVRKIYLADQTGRVPESIWFGDEVGTTREASAELAELLPSVPPFATPKPERLISRILEVATQPDDIVIDSFLGSGTTAAVAQKMRRKWIGIEVGEHAITHAHPRLCKVIEGADDGGVTLATSWNGGGGFRFYRLAPSLLERDKWNNWVVNKQFNKEMLAEAVCKLEGFVYEPSTTCFWMHGRSTERDFLYVTTQFLTHEQLASISDEVGPERTLLVCCSAYRAKLEQFPNLTVKKIPAAVLSRCEWGKDDYSLNVAQLTTEAEATPTPDARGTNGDARPAVRARRKPPPAVQEFPLFEKKPAS